MHFALLGPLEVSRDGGRVGLGSAKQRLLLAALLRRPSETVPTAALTVALWGDDPPASAAANLRTYVRGLRTALGDGAPGTGSRAHRAATCSGSSRDSGTSTSSRRRRPAAGGP